MSTIMQKVLSFLAPNSKSSVNYQNYLTLTRNIKTQQKYFPSRSRIKISLFGTTEQVLAKF